MKNVFGETVPGQEKAHKVTGAMTAVCVRCPGITEGGTNPKSGGEQAHSLSEEVTSKLNAGI